MIKALVNQFFTDMQDYVLDNLEPVNLEHAESAYYEAVDFGCSVEYTGPLPNLWVRIEEEADRFLSENNINKREFYSVVRNEDNWMRRDIKNSETEVLFRIYTKAIHTYFPDYIN